MWQVIELRKWTPEIDLINIPPCECSRQIIHSALLRIISGKKMTAEEVATIFDEVGSDMSVILWFLKDATIDDTRKRSLWMIAGYYDETKWLTVPKDFLPHFECERREKERTQAYAFSQAYVLSKKIALDYLRNQNLYWYYNELPNLLIACMQLHQLRVFPNDIWSASGHETLLSEAIMFAQLLHTGVKDFFIQKTPAVKELLQAISIKRVV